MKLLILILFLIPNIVFAGPMKMIGEKGKPSEVTRSITIKMHDNYYEPAEINVKKDETIKFIVLNVGELMHEFNIATKEIHIKHQPEMMMLVENEILLSDKVDKDKMKQMAKKIHQWFTPIQIAFCFHLVKKVNWFGNLIINLK